MGSKTEGHLSSRQIGKSFICIYRYPHLNLLSFYFGLCYMLSAVFYSQQFAYRWKIPPKWCHKKHCNPLHPFKNVLRGLNLHIVSCFTFIITQNWYFYGPDPKHVSKGVCFGQIWLFLPLQVGTTLQSTSNVKIAGKRFLLGCFKDTGYLLKTS